MKTKLSSPQPGFETAESQPTRATLTYLKAIYQCSNGSGFVTTSQLAEYLKVAPASVTAMSQKLAAANPPLVEYHKHHGMHLTAAGESLALRVLRRHRLLESFLVKALGYSWDEVHEEAELLECSVSSRLEGRLSAFTGHPAFDPHGAPIPDASLVVPELPVIPLSQLKLNQCGCVRRVMSDDSGLLRYLTELGIHIGSQVELVGYISYDHTIQVRLDGESELRILGLLLGDVILVEPVPLAGN
jgi:DtxR family transcriptional regulator, Mn-dependent transcriptional regulator